MISATLPTRVAGAVRATPERLYFLRELTAAGYGNRDTLHKRIADGELPALRVGNAWKVRESDLALLAQPIGAPRTSTTATPSTPTETLGDLAEAARELVTTWPRLTDEDKAELSRILAPAA